MHNPASSICDEVERTEERFPNCGHRVDAVHERAHVHDEMSECAGRIGDSLFDRGAADFVGKVVQRRDLEGDRKRGDGEHALEVESRPEHERGVRVGTRAVEAGDLGDELGAVLHALRADDDVEEVGGEHAENGRGVLRRLRDVLLRLQLVEVEYNEARARRRVARGVVGL